MNSRFGKMQVIGTDQHTGRRYWCACGWEGWTVWGRALKHAETCPRANEEPVSLTKEERDAIQVLRDLSRRWPASLTLTVGSISNRLYVIRTPQQGDEAYDDVGKAHAIEVLKFPVGASS